MIVEEFNYSNDTFGEIPKDTVKCAVCGSEYKALASHVWVHGYTAKQYMKLFDIPKGQMIADSVREKHRARAKRELMLGGGFAQANESLVNEKEKSITRKGFNKWVKTGEARDTSVRNSIKSRDKVKEWWTLERRKERSAMQSRNKKMWWDKLKLSQTKGDKR